GPYPPPRASATILLGRGSPGRPPASRKPSDDASVILTYSILGNPQPMCHSKSRWGICTRVGGRARGLCMSLGWAIVWAGGASAAGDGGGGPALDSGPGPEAIHAAIDRGLPLLIKASAREYPRHRDCFSCHNQAVPAIALDLARRHGFAVEA